MCLEKIVDRYLCLPVAKFTKVNDVNLPSLFQETKAYVGIFARKIRKIKRSSFSECVHADK